MLQTFARWMLARLGWSLDFNGLPGPRGILIVYPHTSNWDFIFGLLAKWAIGLKLTWIGKESLFRGFTGATLGRLMRLWGGRPVNRHHASGAVEQWAQLIEGEPWCWLTLSPEGTRKHQDHLRTGFYHLALRTRLPVGLGYIDYGRRQVGVSRFVQMSGDEDRDLALLSDYYGDRRGLRPGNAATIRFRPRK